MEEYAEEMKQKAEAARKEKPKEWRRQGLRASECKVCVIGH